VNFNCFEFVILSTFECFTSLYSNKNVLLNNTLRAKYNLINKEILLFQQTD